MRMVLPCCSIGGFCSMRLTLASSSPPKSHEFWARIFAETETLLPVPVWTVMLPELETTSKSTGPETWSVRSKWPVAEALAGNALIADNATRMPKVLNAFMFPPKTRNECLLENDFLAFLQAGEKLCLGSVRDAYGYRDFLLAVLGRGIRHLDRRLAVFVVDQRPFRNHQYALMLFQDDFGIRSHLRFQLALGVVNRDPHFKGRDIIFLDTHA